MSRGGFSCVNSSPWRRIVFTIETDASFNTWGRVTNDAFIAKLQDHLGFKATPGYLEVRYISVKTRRLRAGTALAMRIYRIESDRAGDASKYAVIKEQESYSANSFAYPYCSLVWDKVSQTTPLVDTEKQAVLALYPHILGGEGNNAAVVLSMTILYRHAATPFETEPSFARKITLDLTPRLSSSARVTSPFESLYIDSPAEPDNSVGSEHPGQ